MSKKSPRHQPPIPQLPLEAWKRLINAAADFARVAPWVWMHDSQVIGLRHPATNEVLLCSILGRMRSVFALLVCRNPGGHRVLLHMILNDGDSGEDDDAAFYQDAIKAEFVLKRDLAKEDRAMLKAAGFSPAKKSGAVWPQFRSIMPGAAPWHISAAEAETLIFTLPRVAAMARLSREEPGVWEQHCEGEVAFLPAGFDPAAAKLHWEQIEWQPMIPPPATVPEPCSLEATTVDELLKLKQAKGFHLELDLVYSFLAVINDGDRPRLPRLAMAVDRVSGFVGGFHLSGMEDPTGANALKTVLRSACRQLGARPESIRVQRPGVAAILAKIASQLNTPVVKDPDLPELNHARASMEAFFEKRMR